MAYIRPIAFAGGVVSLSTALFSYSVREKVQHLPPKQQLQKTKEIFLSHFTRFLTENAYTKDRHINLAISLISAPEKEANYRLSNVMPSAKDPVFTPLAHETFMFAGTPDALLDEKARTALLRGNYIRCQGGNSFNETDVLIAGTKNAKACEALMPLIMDEFMHSIQPSSR